MTVTLNKTSDCCEPVCDTTVVNTPGPAGAAGAAGAAGTNGTDGKNGYSLTTSDFTIPNVGAAVNIFVDDVALWSQNAYCYVEGSGHYIIAGKGVSHITAVRLGYPTDLGVTGDTITTGSTVAPAGARGETGAAGSSVLLSAKAQLLTHTGSAQVALSGGGNDTYALFSKSAAATGLAWRKPAFTDFSDQLDLTSQVKNKLPLTTLGNSGGANGDIAYWNGSNWVRIPAGTSEGKYLKVVGGIPTYADISSTSLSVAARAEIAATVSGSSITGSTATNEINIPTTGCLTGAVGGAFTCTLSYSTAISTPNPIIVANMKYAASNTWNPVEIVSMTVNSIEMHIDGSASPFVSPFTLYFAALV